MEVTECDIDLCSGATGFFTRSFGATIALSGAVAVILAAAM